jgi:hypothetical protein
VVEVEEEEVLEALETFWVAEEVVVLKPKISLVKVQYGRST